MKTTSILTAALSTSLVAASPMIISGSHPQVKRQSQFGAIAGLPDELAALLPNLAKSGQLPGVVKTAINAGYGKQKSEAAHGTAKEVANRNPQIPGAKTVKIRYGPYTVPNMNHKNFLGEAGALFNYPDTEVMKPCQGACTVLGMNADLEYEDGSNANIGNGMWLHHMVLFNVGPGRMDPTCVGQMSLPHLLIGSDPGHSERLIASGNERAQVRFTSPYNPTDRLGYFMNDSDEFRLIVDFMNENEVDKTVWMTMTYDYLPDQPKEFSNFKSIWFDAAQCGTSEVKPTQESGKFTIGPVDWIANLDADIMGAGGHLHDGGVNVQLIVDGNLICDSQATYGVTAPNGTVAVTSGAKLGIEAALVGQEGAKASAMEGMANMRTAIESVNRLVSTSEHGPDPVKPKAAAGGMGGMSGGAAGSPHIVYMSPCYGKTLGIPAIRKGQKWSITGTYDYDKYSGMKEDGKQSNVMAIAMMFVKNPKL